MDTSMSHELSNLRKFVAPEILFGAGARKAVANYARTFGARKVLLVSDPCSMRVHCAAKSCACG
jgi:alcohol dehydrogenase class IV